MESILSNYSSPFLAAIAIGLSCGTGCSPIISLFLTTYIMGNSGNVKRGLLSFFYFFLGKTSVIVVLAFLSAIVGSTVLGKDGNLLGFNLKIVLDVFLILTGLILTLKMFFSKNKEGCTSCDSCGGKEKDIKNRSGLAVFFIGAAYGITPCAPLLMILVLASLTSPITSVPISVLFSITSSISPLILLAAMAGFFSKKMHDEIPQFIKLFQLLSFIIFIVAGSVSLYFHLL